MRILDIVISSLTLVLLLPVFIFILFLGILDTGYPLYFQKRVGLNQKLFTLIKFRTMKINTSSVGTHLVDLSNITYLGHFLRKFKLDELPQLINVLVGDMSLVGPRPLLLQYLERYSAEQVRRHDVKPGITGWVQVNGRNAISWEDKFNLDVWYVDNHSLMLDIKILLLTLKKVLTREGISAAGGATAPRFTKK
jgi:lipopolysaccharide/colanic/teichoic acid biosynthesis glycosyltransferase